MTRTVWQFLLATLIIAACPVMTRGGNDPVSGIVSSAGDFVKGIGKVAGVGVSKDQLDKDASRPHWTNSANSTKSQPNWRKSPGLY